MNKFIEWLQALTPEFYIFFILIILLFVLIIFTLNRIGSIRKHLFRDSLILSEDMLREVDVSHTRVKITNVSFYNMIIHEYGFMQKNIKHSIKSARISIDERDDITETYLSDEIRSMFSISNKNKIYFYIIDSGNRIKKKKLKLLNRYIRKEIKSEKLAEKLRLKNIRFEEGNFNFGERIVLILKVIVSPIVKLYKLLTRKTNSGLHKRNQKINKKKQEKILILENKEEDIQNFEADPIELSDEIENLNEEINEDNPVEDDDQLI